METQPSLTLAEQFAAACDWWREAGVDQDFLDAPESMLKEAEAAKGEAPKLPRKKPPAPPVEKPKIGGDRAAWPETFEAFGAWWAAEPSLDDTATTGRIAPRGVKNAELMVIIPMPEAGDEDMLLSAQQGTLIANMLKAMGIGEDAVYLACVLPRHLPHSDWDRLKAEGMGDILIHHIALAQPKRLLVLGRDILQLLDCEMRRGVQDLPVNEGSIQLLASFNPENLLQNARLRADLWRRWLDWTHNT